MRVTPEPIYSDLDLNFTPHPLTGDLTPKKNMDSVKQAIRNLMNIDAFDIPFDGDKQMNLRRILFDQVSQLTESRLRTQIEWIIKKCEKRVTLQRVDVVESSDFVGYHITVWYQIKSIMQDDSYKFFVERVR